MKYTEIKPLGKMVALQGFIFADEPVEDITKKKNGIIGVQTDNQSAAGQVVTEKSTGQKAKLLFYITAVGPEAEELKEFIGHEVMVNEYDVQYFKDDSDRHFALCQKESIRAVLTTDAEVIPPVRRLFPDVYGDVTDQVLQNWYDEQNKYKEILRKNKAYLESLNRNPAAGMVTVDR